MYEIIALRDKGGDRKMVQAVIVVDIIIGLVREIVFYWERRVIDRNEDCSRLQPRIYVWVVSTQRVTCDKSSLIITDIVRELI